MDPDESEDSICNKKQGKYKFQVPGYSGEHPLKKQGNSQTDIDHCHKVSESGHESRKPKPVERHNKKNTLVSAVPAELNRLNAKNSCRC